MWAQSWCRLIWGRLPPRVRATETTWADAGLLFVKTAHFSPKGPLAPPPAGSAFHLQRFILRGDVTHGLQKKGLSGGSRRRSRNQSGWYSPPHRCWGQIQVACLRECLKSESEMVALRLERLSKTDTVGASAHTRGGVVLSPHPPHHHPTHPNLGPKLW